MDKLVIEGGVQLNGAVSISGAKNAALPILVATLLAPGEHELHNVPELVDVSFMLSLLGRIGCPSLVGIGGRPDRIRLDTTRLAFCEAPYDVVRKMRASVLVLGPLLARCGEAHVSLPGGCAIGVRPIDQHLKGLEALGCTFRLEGGYVHGSVDQLVGADIELDVPTVTGTENIMMAAVLADGITTIRNAAAEPEIVDLARFLRSMGARIKGEGTATLEIDGVPALRPARRPYSIMGDRIEAGTYLLAGAITGGDVTAKGAPVADMGAVLAVLEETGCTVECDGDSIRVCRSGPLKAVDISTQPHPGFPTDMQAQWVALMTQASGTSVVEENIFENRFMHVAELHRMGANIDLSGNTATITGDATLTGATVMATDLRASASLILAGLAADGVTEMLRIYHLDRGYERLVGKLEQLGASVRRVSEDTTVAVGAAVKTSAVV
ncbi:MAG: UDP-N-acetylglucosamine 1-carboxyvinyltransferase [Myxococcota bacterium]|jgi:UDP-N-acetylglucosamine 1-carboxyvinyltransferase|nr:UDP-N-acetylglucosamine 1-carboxyvinyltransferase [Myxococcota bacterium]MEC9390405.1 UDP-N-acetylglucosamine 1-carboxyvinyltransferase [Myxococcota bacterium]